MCENPPRFRPKTVVARPSGEPYGRLQCNRGTRASLGSPTGAARRRLGVVLAFQTPCQFRAASCDRFAARLRLGLPALTRGASPRGPLRAASPCLRHLPSASLRRISPRGYARESPNDGELCVAPPLVRRPLATAFGGDLRSGHTFGSPSARGYPRRGGVVRVRCAPKRQVCRYTGRVTAAKQHPSGRLRRCPAGSAYAERKARRFSAKQARRKSAALFLPAQSAISRSYFRFEVRARADSPRFAAVCAAACAHFAALPLVRSTFGLRGYPRLPARRISPRVR